MKKTTFIILGMALSFCLGFFLKAMMNEPSENKTDDKQPMITITSEVKMVTGIGGIFFKSEDPDKLKEWYKTHLGFETNQYGYRFEFLSNTEPTQQMGIQWSPFGETNQYFAPSSKAFMINYSVQDLNKLVDQLKKQGIQLLDSIQTYEYGKFVHLMDIEGNKIELYEPNYNYNPESK